MQRATQQLLLEARHVDVVISFASFGDEINLWPLNYSLLQKGLLALPRVSDDGTLEIYHVASLQGTLIRSSWGVLEPDPQYCKRLSISEDSLVFVPGLGFDPSGNRLGYGKGCYDRFLCHLPASTMTMGVGFLEQSLIDSFPIEDTDVALKDVALF